jgi:hypothetical protein
LMTLRGTALPLILLMVFPFSRTSLDIIKKSSLSISIFRLFKASKKFSLSPISKTPSTKADFLPFLIRSLDALSPNRSCIALINTDFPDPVSPVKTLNPASKLTDTSSNTAKFFIFKLSSILSPLSYKLLKFLQDPVHIFYISYCYKNIVVTC